MKIKHEGLSAGNGSSDVLGDETVKGYAVRSQAAGIAWRAAKRWQWHGISAWASAQRHALYWLAWVPLAFLGFKPNPGGGKRQTVRLDAEHMQKVMRDATALLDSLKG